MAVTGATGFIGAHLLTHLRGEGYGIRAMTRSPRASGNGISWIDGDLAGGRGVDELVRGADTVVHCAGAVRGAHPRDFDAINVDGTRRIAEAAAAAGVKRLLLLSSLAAREPSLSMYASSKRRGEDAVRSVDIASTVFRPPAVYGPGDNELAPLFGLMLRGIAVVPGHAGRTSLLYVTDLARAVGAWLRAPSHRGGECFELDDGTPQGYDWTEMIRIAQTVRGAAIRRLDIPQPLLDAIGRVNLGLGRAFHRAPMLTPGKVRELFHRDWVCRTQQIRSALAWQPEVQFAEGLKRTFADPSHGAE
ncbi:MAG TPA: NAD-dependent epimerase/dehydratase family protein [Pseudomonadales bacterium]